MRARIEERARELAAQQLGPGQLGGQPRLEQQEQQQEEEQPGGGQVEPGQGGPLQPKAEPAARARGDTAGSRPWPGLSHGVAPPANDLHSV